MMSAKSENESIFDETSYEINFKNFIIPFSSIISKNRDKEIYNGREQMAFKNRHPIFRALMKIEFEEDAKSWTEKIF